MEIKYHLDESVANAVANGLEHHGIDVITSKAAGLIGVSDPEQLDYAMRGARVLVTHDDDFPRIHAAGVEHAGIAYQRRLTIGQTVLALIALHRNQNAESVAGHVEFLQPNRSQLTVTDFSESTAARRTFAAAKRSAASLTREFRGCRHVRSDTLNGRASVDVTGAPRGMRLDASVRATEVSNRQSLERVGRFHRRT